MPPPQIAPKREALAKAQAEADTVAAQLAANQAQLAEVEEKLAAMEKQLEDSMNRKKELESEVGASRLTGLLEGHQGHDAAIWVSVCPWLDAYLLETSYLWLPTVDWCTLTGWGGPLSS